MRKQPSIEPPNVSILANQQPTMTIREERRYKLITPLFGGGAEPGACDEVTTIRATEIRGLLRFWWRACRGGQFGDDLKTMKAVEDAIWGSPVTSKDTTRDQKSTGSRYYETIQIIVEAPNPQELLHLYPYGTPSGNNNPRHRHTNAIPHYAAFPLESEKKAVYDNVTFILTITFPKTKTIGGKVVSIEQEVHAAFWAWETFGGVGGRTRRGFGALSLVSIGEKTNTDLPHSSRRWDVEQWLNDKYAKFVTDGSFPENVPHLCASDEIRIVSTYPHTSVFDVWQQLITRLSKFRQKRNRYGGGWPESQSASRTLREDSDQPLPFPKAVIGLPIVFHLKDEVQAVLQREEDKQDRLASPLILRPLLCRNNQAVGLALLLEGNPLPEAGVILVKQKDNYKHYPARVKLSVDEARNIPALQENTDVLEALINQFGRKNKK
jgi:CRISPR-associated protein Cmr1